VFDDSIDVIDLPNEADDYVNFPDLSAEYNSQHEMVFHNECPVIYLQNTF